ncbi:integrator complex subunit 13-like [Halichondria panicea]|uniref:integrator complex subunit 13-like n=1 Tax=Halichondria panicea TaxID=6063 RepID=UPI00312B4988
MAVQPLRVLQIGGMWKSDHSLYEKEKANEPLSIPTGGRNKGVKRDEQYRSLWSELEDLAHMYSSNSERHRHLLEFLLQMTSRCPSMQLPRKTPPIKTENGSTATESSLNWRDVEKHSNDRGGRSVNGSDYKWNMRTQEGHRPHPLVDGGLPTLAKPGDSLLSMWTNRKRVAADGCHQEFASRSYGESKIELYKNLRTSNVAPLLDHE